MSRVRPCSLGTVRLTEFQELLHTEFGVSRGDVLLADHVLPAMNGRTGAQAIEDGADPHPVIGQRPRRDGGFGATLLPDIAHASPVPVRASGFGPGAAVPRCPRRVS